MVIRYKAVIKEKHEQGQRLWIVITMGTNKWRQADKRGVHGLGWVSLKLNLKPKLNQPSTKTA